jgi:hypothetical protein
MNVLIFKLLWKVHQLQYEPGSTHSAHIDWPVPENVEIVVTLFHDPRRCEFETKEWTFALELAVSILCYSFKFSCKVLYDMHDKQLLIHLD